MVDYEGEKENLGATVMVDYQGGGGEMSRGRVCVGNAVCRGIGVVPDQKCKVSCSKRNWIEIGVGASS